MMRRVLFAIWLGILASAALAQERSALSRLAGPAQVVDSADGMTLTLPLTIAVPYRVYQLADPWRIVVESRQIDWTGLAIENARIVETRFGQLNPEWTRLVFLLDAPLGLKSVQMPLTDGATGRLEIALARQTPEAFAAFAGAPGGQIEIWPRRAPDVGPAVSPLRQPGEPLRVVLDPGHGGIDPGAEVGQVNEADLMLGFARELQELLRRSGNIEVTLTRTDDAFVPLEARVSAAHAAGAHVFISLHADVVLEGNASGATVYTLSDDASDIASEKLAERHDREDLLAGVDLTDQDDVVARVLMDMARTDTAHRTNEFAGNLISAMETKIDLYKKPRLEAGFSVLKAPDIPSVLIELGFMSSQIDLDNIQNPEWRLRAAMAIRDGLVLWAIEDEAEADLRGK